MDGSFHIYWGRHEVEWVVIVEQAQSNWGMTKSRRILNRMHKYVSDISNNKHKWYYIQYEGTIPSFPCTNTPYVPFEKKTRFPSVMIKHYRWNMFLLNEKCSIMNKYATKDMFRKKEKKNFLIKLICFRKHNICTMGQIHE